MIDALRSMQSLVWIAFCTALIAVSAFIALPLGPIPFTLQVLMVFVTSLILGPKRAVIAFALYLFLGAVGFPIFSGGRSGLAAFASPTGGYLIGFIPFAFIAGFASKQKQIVKSFIILMLALLVLYVCGTSWFVYSLDVSFQKAIAVTVLPFVFFDILKIIFALLVWRFLAQNQLIPQ